MQKVYATFIKNKKAYTWQGTFPVLNEPIDGFKYISPIKSYDPNSIGLYDMSGNAWEITSDYFNVNYYQFIKDSTLVNPKRAKKGYDHYIQERVIKGGSFLCNVSY